MAKPIVVFQLPRTFTQSYVDKFRPAVEEKLSDWHCLFINNLPGDMDFEVKAFSAEKSTDIEIEELKHLLLNEIHKAHDSTKSADSDPAL